ncbi:MAG TPA: DUF4253 domain-containing protein [Actinomycetes bacterium]|jgi:hypothetical protein|nr:DUF4253 domain-containing protein [Actinomycetes bacterium]
MSNDATPPLPTELAQLFVGGAAGRRLPVVLPAGRLVRPGRHGGDTAETPAYWLSDQPAPATLWSKLHAAHPQSGLWPLLLEGLNRDPSLPWVAGTVGPQPAGEIDRHDAAGFLASVWADWAQEQEGEEDIGYDFEDLAPFGRHWPGLASPGEPMDDPEVVADWYAGLLGDGRARLGLVAANRSADALAVSGWTGPTNHAPTAPLAAVVRSWEDRFGARVVRVGFDTLDLSVAAPPATAEHALHVAAEHFAFCPDNIQQASLDFSQNTLAAYAEQIRGRNSWGFWWD